MLKTIDRIQIATESAERAAHGWLTVLGAELDSTDTVAALSAKRTTYRLGRGAIEFLEPDGEGIIANALEVRGRSHLFAGGVSTGDFEAVVARLKSQGIEPAIENGQAFFNAASAVGVDCNLVLSPYEERPAVGGIDFLYEVTLLADDAAYVVAKFAELFDLHQGNFVEIKSERFAYSGVLTLFSPDDLHRFEIITPHSDATTMGRFFKRQGAAYYMCFAETAQMNRLSEKASENNAGITIDRPEDRSADLPADQMWLHPPALGGVMLGLSRSSMAWRWSGHPDRVEEVS